ncbi:MAG: hypothetical protein ABI895_12725 [Deltaproteobacteria bacterium]
MACQIRATANADVYCFFDNTAPGAAAINALALKTELATPLMGAGSL